MHKAIPLSALALLCATALPAAKPAKPVSAAAIDTRGVSGGSYVVDQNHTQVGWRINHMGFNDYFGLFGQVTGTLSLDKADPSKSKVSVTIPVSQLATSSEGLNKHMLSADFLNASQFAEAKFESTHVMVMGQTAMIHGNLTLLGVTKPVTLDARLSGAGSNMMTKKETLGFHATTKIKRSEWGMTKYVPAVGDEVTLQISVAFEK
jgi:polyisoprenoid-binding protein YceI